ncbi:unnamed protein product [Debaryomyces tyrocola]|nr:unnamed protein product [Debaryomyces tyrocola]
MSKPFQSINDVINTTSKHKQQSFNELYGEPENFLEIEVCKSLMSDIEYHSKIKIANISGTKSTNTLWKRTLY